MRPAFKTIAFLGAFGTLVGVQSAKAADCHQVMGNFESHEGVSYCDDGSVEVGGKIKDVSTHTPLGGKNGFFQKAGRDGQGVVQRANQNFKGAMHAIGFKSF